VTETTACAASSWYDETEEALPMTLTVPLSPEEQAVLVAQAQAQGVSVDALLRKAVLQIIATAPEISPLEKKPTRSCLGALAHLGPAPSAEDIDENRAEMFANFGRDDIA